MEISDRSNKRRGAAASWFPGHIAAGLRAVSEAASIIDLVIEVRDARIPAATSVATLHQSLRNKPLVVLLNRQDLAEQAATQRWLDALGLVGIKAFSTTATRAGTLRAVRTTLRAFPGRSTRIRAAVVGAPNTGKSSVINALASRKKAARENRAGVTRHVNWISLDEGVDLLDTPGVLEPRITDPARAWQLALCGILPESAFDVEEVAVCFADWTAGHGRDANRTLDLNSFARRRGMLRNRGEIDRRNAARALLTSFREGRLGRYTLELPGDHQ